MRRALLFSALCVWSSSLTALSDDDKVSPSFLEGTQKVSNRLQASNRLQGFSRPGLYRGPPGGRPVQRDLRSQQSRSQQSREREKRERAKQKEKERKKKRERERKKKREREREKRRKQRREEREEEREKRQSSSHSTASTTVAPSDPVKDSDSNFEYSMSDEDWTKKVKKFCQDAALDNVEYNHCESGETARNVINKKESWSTSRFLDFSFSDSGGDLGEKYTTAVASKVCNILPPLGVKCVGNPPAPSYGYSNSDVSYFSIGYGHEAPKRLPQIFIAVEAMEHFENKEPVSILHYQSSGNVMTPVTTDLKNLLFIPTVYKHGTGWVEMSNRKISVVKMGRNEALVTESISPFPAVYSPSRRLTADKLAAVNLCIMNPLKEHQFGCADTRSLFNIRELKQYPTKELWPYVADGVLIPHSFLKGCDLVEKRLKEMIRPYSLKSRRTDSTDNFYLLSNKGSTNTPSQDVARDIFGSERSSNPSVTTTAVTNEAFQSLLQLTVEDHLWSSEGERLAILLNIYKVLCLVTSLVHNGIFHNNLSKAIWVTGESKAKSGIEEFGMSQFRLLALDRISTNTAQQASRSSNYEKTRLLSDAAYVYGLISYFCDYIFGDVRKKRDFPLATIRFCAAFQSLMSEENASVLTDPSPEKQTNNLALLCKLFDEAFQNISDISPRGPRGQEFRACSGVLSAHSPAEVRQGLHFYGG